MQKIVTELRQRDLVLQDHKKRCFEVQGQQDDFAKLYDVIKNEKNKYVHLIQASTQKAAELREKLVLIFCLYIDLFLDYAYLQTKWKSCKVAQRKK